MIEANRLTKWYGNHRAIEDLTFSVQRGEVVGLLGLNGAGKTSAMRILAGFMPPTSGKARVAGYDVLDDSLAVRSRVGYLPERAPIYPDMTVKEYLTFFAKLRGSQRPQKQVDRVLEKMGLSGRHNSLARQLSKGLRQRLGLAQALVHQPEVVILDEPTLGIDPQQAAEVRQLVRELGRRHTVLFSTHILSEAEQTCDRVLILHQGRLIAEGTPTTLRQALQAGVSLYVLIGGVSSGDARRLLEEVPGVAAVEAAGEGYHVRALLGVDLRADISRRVADAGYSLLELHPVATTLEDVFLDAVGKSS